MLLSMCEINMCISLYEVCLMEGNKKMFENGAETQEVGTRVPVQGGRFFHGKIKWLSLAACLVVLLVAALTLTVGAFSGNEGAHATSVPHGIKSPKHAHSPSSVGKSKPTLSISPLSLNFSASASALRPVFQAVTIKNGGTRALYWHATVSTSGATWVTTSDQKSQELGIRTTSDKAGQLKIYVNATGLKAGSYTALVTVTGTDQQSQVAGGSPQTVTVTLTVS
jgi:hypothetical protein